MKNSGDRSMSAALQHRRMAGSFDKSRAEKLHSNVCNGRHPTHSRRSREHHASAVIDALDGSKELGLLSSLGIGVAVAGSMLVVSYAAVLSAIADAA